MNNANAMDIFLVAILITLVGANLITAGMTSALITGVTLGAIYMLEKKLTGCAYDTHHDAEQSVKRTQ